MDFDGITRGAVLASLLGILVVSTPAVAAGNRGDTPPAQIKKLLERTFDSSPVLSEGTVALTDSAKVDLGSYLLLQLERKARTGREGNLEQSLKRLKQKFDLKSRACDRKSSVSLSEEDVPQFFREILSLYRKSVNKSLIESSSKSVQRAIDKFRYFQINEDTWLIQSFHGVLDQAPVIVLSRRDGSWRMKGLDWLPSMMNFYYLANYKEQKPRKIHSERDRKKLERQFRQGSRDFDVNLIDFHLGDWSGFKIRVRIPDLPNVGLWSLGEAGQGSLNVHKVEWNRDRAGLPDWRFVGNSSLEFRRDPSRCDGLFAVKRVFMDEPRASHPVEEIRGSVTVTAPLDFTQQTVAPEPFVTSLETEQLNGWLYGIDSRHFILNAEDLPDDLWTIGGTNESGGFLPAIPKLYSGTFFDSAKFIFEAPPENLGFYSVKKTYEKDYDFSERFDIRRTELSVPVKPSDNSLGIRVSRLSGTEDRSTFYFDRTQSETTVLEVHGQTAGGRNVYLEGRSMPPLENANHQVLTFSKPVEKLVIFTTDE